MNYYKKCLIICALMLKSITMIFATDVSKDIENAEKLHDAVEKGYIDAVRACIEDGIKINTVLKGRHCIYTVFLARDLLGPEKTEEMLEVLLSLGADINFINTDDEGSFTVLDIVPINLVPWLQGKGAKHWSELK